MGLRRGILQASLVLALGVFGSADALAQSVTTRLVTAGGAATSATIQPGGTVSIDVRLDATNVPLIGTGFTLSETTPACSGFLSVTGRSFTGSPFNDTNSGTADSVALVAPGNLLDPSFGKGKSCKNYEPPARVLGAHVGALGMRFYTGKMFPEKYKNSILLAEHGSWNRARKDGYRVMLAQLEGNKVVSYEPLVQGWLNVQTDQVSGRPTDVEMLDDGSLLISDDYRGAVYRVTYKSPS